MNRRTTIQQELQSLNSSLPSYLNEPVFTVPNGYFEHFPERMLQLVQSAAVQMHDSELHALAPTLAGLAKKMPLTVPENYFGALSHDVPVLMRSEDALPSILSERREMPYTVPAGYFGNFTSQMHELVAGNAAKPVALPQQGRMVAMFGQWRRAAVAASVAVAVAVGGWLYWNGQNVSSGEEVVHNGVLNDVSTQELDRFIQSTDAVYGSNTEATKASGAAQKLLLDVSNNDLDAFLQEVPHTHDL